MAENEIKEERDLVLEAQNGDRAAFEALMDATMGKSWALAWRLTGNLAEAEDLVQETYIRAWTNIGKFKGESGFATWLYRIENNCCLDDKRREKKRREVPLDPAPAGDKPGPQPADPAPGAPENLENAERASSLRKALDSLEPDYRRVLVLRELESLSYEEISAALEIPVGTVAAWLFRARSAFREAYLQFSGEKV
jgi:RNA polymerase sigma-70 factor (ECF subfamily)